MKNKLIQISLFDPLVPYIMSMAFIKSQYQIQLCLPRNSNIAFSDLKSYFNNAVVDFIWNKGWVIKGTIKDQELGDYLFYKFVSARDLINLPDTMKAL